MLIYGSVVLQVLNGTLGGDVNHVQAMYLSTIPQYDATSCLQICE